MAKSRPRLFTTTQIVKICEVTNRQAVYVRRTSLVPPSFRLKSTYYYDMRGLTMLWVLFSLRKQRHSRQSLASLVEPLERALIQGDFRLDRPITFFLRPTKLGTWEAMAVTGPFTGYLSGVAVVSTGDLLARMKHLGIPVPVDARHVDVDTARTA